MERGQTGLASLRYGGGAATLAFIDEMSPPAQKARPDPRRTRTATLGSSAAAAIERRNARASDGSSAFSAAGRFVVRNRIPPSRLSSRTASVMP